MSDLNLQCIELELGLGFDNTCILAVQTSLSDIVTPRDVHASKKKTVTLPHKFTKLEPFRANLFSVENLLISD